MALSANKLKEYKVLIDAVLANKLTPGQLALAKEDGVVRMVEEQASHDGSSDVYATFETWVTSKPLALSFLKNNADFKATIESTPATTAADALPATYVTLHGETTSNEAKIAGVLALRALGVDSTYADGHANLGGTAGTALSDANVVGLYSTYGATKFNAIFSKGVIKAIQNESDANYDTLAEVVAIYDAWGGGGETVAVGDFFKALDDIYDAGYTGLKFSDLYADASSVTNFKAHTASNVVKLMASTGGTWSGVTGLAAQKFADMTTDNAVRAVEKCGATFTSIDNVYTASSTKANTLLSKSLVDLCSKGYTGFNFAGLSTAYGTTYTAAKDVEFRNIAGEAANWELFGAGLTYANALAAGDKLKCVANDNGLKTLVVNSGIADTLISDLTTPADFGGIQSLGDLCG
jgi:hypothetical protein